MFGVGTEVLLLRTVRALRVSVPLQLAGGGTPNSPVQRARSGVACPFAGCAA